MLFVKDRLHYGADGRYTAGGHRTLIVARAILVVHHADAMVMMDRLGRRSHTRPRGERAGEGKNCQYESDPADHMDQVTLPADR